MIKIGNSKMVIDKNISSDTPLFNYDMEKDKLTLPTPPKGYYFKIVSGKDEDTLNVTTEREPTPRPVLEFENYDTYRAYRIKLKKDHYVPYSATYRQGVELNIGIKDGWVWNACSVADRCVCFYVPEDDATYSLGCDEFGVVIIEGYNGYARRHRVR